VGAQQREINERLQAVLTLTPDGFVSFDQQQCIGLASPALHRLTCLDTARLQGQTAADFFAQLHALCRPGTPMPSLLALQARAGAAPMTLDLATRPPRTLSLELCDGTHPLVRHVLCLRDVTHQREVERLKSEFITVAAHELRTPMTIIYGYAEMMMRQQLQDTTRQELQTVIHRQCRLMMSIMDDLMDLGRLEAHPGQALTVAPVDLGALLRATAATLPLPPGRQPPRAHDDAPWPEARVAGNADHLVRLINNVLGNAYKYSPAGTVVEIGLARRPTAGGVDEICISVADQGIGMTPEQLARVGERFYRADTSGHIPGTGLGMSIVGEIARLHGGHVNLQSTPGEGTRVDICLPALPPAGVAPDVGSAAPPPDISR
jgi:signal transduction histidine kinase